MDDGLKQADFQRATAVLADLDDRHAAAASRLRKALDGRDDIELMAAVVGAELELRDADPNYKAWTAAAHPRAPAGVATGGQFVSAGTSSTTTSKAATEGARQVLGKELTPENIRRYQQAHGLTVDGKIGRQTAAALLGSAHPQSVPPGPMTDQQRRGLEALSRRVPARAKPTAPPQGSRYPRRSPPATAGKLQPKPGFVKPAKPNPPRPWGHA
jgi:Putative peptidoglycan binding domain